MVVMFSVIGEVVAMLVVVVAVVRWLWVGWDDS